MRSRTFLAITILVSGVASPTLAEPIDDLAQKYLPWVAEQTGYSADYVKPVIFFKSQAFLNDFYYGANYRDGYMDVEAAAAGNVIFLRDDFEIGVNDDTLVHELTHVLQNENGATFPCMAAQEREAYDLQDTFVTEFGIGEHTDPLMKLLLTSCPIGRGVP